MVLEGLLNGQNCGEDGFYGSIQIASAKSRLAMTVWWVAVFLRILLITLVLCNLNLAF